MSVTIERGYRAEITAAGISFSGAGGGATASWALPGLITDLNDGDPHFLAMDFANEGGTTWRLKTSLDGLGWEDRLTQAGPAPASVTDTAPSVSLAAAAAGAFADEVVMWAGHDEFNHFQLENLHDLGDVFTEPMNQYQEFFGAPICWQATASVGGKPWRDSGCGPCPPVVRVPKGAEDVVVTDNGALASPRIVEG